MFMKQSSINSISTALLAAAALMFSGCQDEDFGYNASEIKYASEFSKAFGKIDPTQDWNLLRQLTNGVDGAMTRAAGNKTTPTGEFTITVLPESQAAPLTTEQMKEYSKMLPESNQGGAPYDKTNLGRVTQNFSAVTNKVVLYPVYWWTNATDEIGIYYYSNESGSASVTGTDGKTYNIVKVPITSNHPEELEYSYEAAANWGQVYSNYGDGSSYFTNHKSNLISKYPTKYALADGTDTYKDQYGSTIASGTFLIYNTTESKWETETAALYSNWAAVWGDLAALDPTHLKVEDGKCYYASNPGGTTWASVDSGLEILGNHIKVDPFIEAAAANSQVGYTGIYPTGFRSKGIVVDLPVSMKIGFYIKNGSDIMYSEGKLNHKMSWAGHTDEDACYIATYQSEETDASGKPIRYLAFEDWYNAGDYDLNDIVFRVYGLETVVDNEEITEEGLFVCEDLGAFDFDFNDVVLKASWKRYYKKTYNKTDGVVTSVTIAQEPSDELIITGMAAGGHNPSDVYFKTATNASGQKLGEIHGILNGSAPEVINAGETYGGDGRSFTFEESQFPAAWNKTSYPTGYVSQMFGEGYLYVIASTTNRVNDPVQPSGAYNTEASHIISSTSYKTNGVPQMMLLPMYYEWCQEDQPIETVYPHFTDWVNDATKTGWLTNGKVEAKTTDRGVTPEMFDRPAAPSSNLSQSTLSATPTSVSLYPSSTSATVSFTYEGSGDITYTVDDENWVDVSMTKNAGAGTITISRNSGWTESGTTYVRIEQAANTTYTSSEVTITVNNSAADLTQSSFSVAEATKSILVTTTGGEEIAITDGTGSGSYSVKSSNVAVAKAEITGYASNFKVNIKPVTEGTATITVTQAGNETYTSSEQTIAVTVSLVASNFAVSTNELNLNANGSAKTITIWSDNSTKPTVSSLTGTDNATIGEVTGGTQHWGAEHNGQWEWTVTVTPKSTEANGSKFTINQEPTATMEGGSKTIIVNVAPAINYGELITFTDNAKSGTIPASKFTSATTSATITLIGTAYYQYDYANETYISSNYNNSEYKFSGNIYSDSQGGIKTIELTGDNLLVAKSQGIRITHGGYGDAVIYVKTE